jgi:hypothetical protein
MCFFGKNGIIRKMLKIAQDITKIHKDIILNFEELTIIFTGGIGNTSTISCVQRLATQQVK